MSSSHYASTSAAGAANYGMPINDRSSYLQMHHQHQQNHPQYTQQSQQSPTPHTHPNFGSATPPPQHLINGGGPLIDNGGPPRSIPNQYGMSGVPPPQMQMNMQMGMHPHQQQQQQQQHQQSPPQLQHQMQQQGMGTGMGTVMQNGSGHASSGYDSGYALSEISLNGERGKLSHPDQAMKLSSYLYTTGFEMAQYSDVQLAIRDRNYNLHRIILSRSPLIKQYIDNVPPGALIVLNVPEGDGLTNEAFAIALSSLYSPRAFEAIHFGNSKDILSTASFLGLPDLAEFAYETCKRSINVDTIVHWVDWIQETDTSAAANNRVGPAPGSAFIQTPVSSSHGQGMDYGGGAGEQVYGGGGVGSFGLGVRPFSPAPSEHRAASASPGSRMTYGKVNGMGMPNGVGPGDEAMAIDWKARLRADIHEFITQTLPHELESNPLDPPVPIAQDPRYLNIFTHLPFDLLRTCIEDPKLKFGGDSQQHRFAFAKSVVAKRKKRAAQILAANPGMTPFPPENVVLQIGGVGHQVHITRGKPKSRTLWKVEKEE